jgi:hypothetical protein
MGGPWRKTDPLDVAHGLTVTAADIEWMLEYYSDTETLTDDGRERIGARLLGLGTRSQWRDAFFYG